MAVPPEDRLASIHRTCLDYLRRITSSEAEAEDLLQESWLRYLGRDDREVEHVLAWLKAVTSNLAISQRQRDDRRRERERRVARAEYELSVVEGLVRLSSQAEVHRLLERCREPYRTALRLRYLEGLTTEQMCQRLGRSPGVVRSRVKRGLDLLRFEIGLISELRTGESDAAT